ncbi:hypothetical protein NL676_004650 [Syzygium grande]|nr:hypothetical protein NL676_004650 [Syzygium grande]
MHQRSFIPMATAAAAAAAASASTATAASAAASAAPSSRSFEIVLRTMQSLVLVVFLLGAVIAVAWLALNPRPPAFRLDSFCLSGLTNASDASSPPPELAVRIQLTATNPNKKFGVVFQDVDDLAVIYHKRPLPLLSHNETSSSEYDIGKRGCRVLIFVVKAGPRPGRGKGTKAPFQFTVGEDMRKGSAVMSVRMQVSIKFMHAYWPSKRASVKVQCENLSVGLSSARCNGELKDGGKNCTVHFS